MSTYYDQTCDPGYSYLRVLVERYPKLGEFTKTANIDENEFSQLPDSAFAWSSERRYPIHTKEHAALSLGYQKLANAKLPMEVEQKLKTAAQVYGIYEELYEENVPKVAENSTYIFPEKKRFMIKTAEDIKLAERRLREIYRQLSVEDRAEGFQRLHKYAKQFGVTLHPSTEKLAGFTLTSTQRLRDWLDARQEVTRGQVFSKAFEKISSTLEGVAPEFKDSDIQVSLVKAIHTLDKEAGLEKLYGDKLPDPIQTVFNTEKRAEDSVEIGTGFLADKGKLSAVPLSFWEDVLGKDVVAEISPDNETVDLDMLMQILPTLPDDLKAIVQKQLAAYF